MSATKLYPSAPLEPKKLSETLEKKMNNTYSFISPNTSVRVSITFFNDENRESEKKFKNYKVSSTLLETVGIFAMNVTTSKSVTLFVTGFGVNETTIFSWNPWSNRII